MNVTAAAITLFLVLDPIGNVPVFLSLLNPVEESRRRFVVAREMVFALVILTVFLFFGTYILRGMRISEPALSIGGGVVLFLIALRMIFPDRGVDAGRPTNEPPLLVPLAVPLTAGPSSMAMLILMATQHPGRIWEWFFALILAWSATSAILVYSDVVRRICGRRVLMALERLMGMILITLAIQMLLSGIRLFIGEIRG